MSEMFSCRLCNNNDFTVDQMKKEKYLLSNKRGVCKPCISNYETTRSMLAKANRNPKRYLSCNDCDKVFNSHISGNCRQNNQHVRRNLVKFKLRVNCPFCKSENIERY